MKDIAVNENTTTRVIIKDVIEQRSSTNENINKSN